MLYLSAAHQLFEPQELQNILDVSQKNNGEAGVSGMMLYDSGSIIQYLEGRADCIAGIWYRIQRDPRHKGIIVASEGAVSERLFPDWSMGLEDGGRFGGFHLDWRTLQDRVPDQFPTVVRTMMRTFYSLGSRP